MKKKNDKKQNCKKTKESSLFFLNLTFFSRFFFKLKEEGNVKHQSHTMDYQLFPKPSNLTYRQKKMGEGGLEEVTTQAE